MNRAALPLLGFVLVLLALVLAAPPAWGQDDESKKEEEDRVTFDVRLREERGGGRVQGSAGDFEYQEGLYLIATGGVDIKYKDLKIKADRARLDLPTNLLTAEGEVVLDEGPRRMAGETLEYDLSTQTGKVTEATAYVDPDYYFSGSQIAKVDDDVYTIDDGIFTSCVQEVPSWSIHLSDARITLEEYARIRNARLKFKTLPVLYAPFIVWPATTDRASGFLVPKPGYSERRGASLDLAYYRTLGRSADTTFFFDLSSEEYFGFGNETRYRPSEVTEGIFELYLLSQPDVLDPDFQPIFEPDRDPDDLRWKVKLFHETRELWDDFRFVVNLEQYSDFDYLQDFERNVGRQTRSFIYSNAYLARNVGQHSLNILADQRERILGGGNEDLRRQLPEVEYRLKPTQLGNTPLYLSLDSNLGYLSIDQTNPNVQLSEQYGRVHFEPTLSVPVSTLSWLSAKLSLGGRATYYTDTLKKRFDDEGNPILDANGDPIGTEFGGGSLSRVVPEGQFEIVGPVFSRIFEKKAGRFEKLKHIVEPRFTYAFLDEFDDQAEIFRFDEIDGLAPPTNGWLVALFNRVMGKPSDPDQGGALEIASLELRQFYSLDDDYPGQGSFVDPTFNTKEGPLVATLRVNPSSEVSFKGTARYNTLFNELQSLSFSGGTKIGRHSLGLTWFTDWQVEEMVTAGELVPAGETLSEQIRLFGKLELIRNRFTLDGEVSYDIKASETRHQRYFLSWRGQCYDWQLEFRESIRGTAANQIEDRDVLFSLSLKNVGTFLDIHESF